MVDEVIKAKKDKGVTAATVNRMLEILRAILKSFH